MSSSVQHKRKERMYFEAASKILAYELTNANISSCTVTDVVLSNDSSHLTIYVTFASHKEKSLEYLQHTKGFVRSHLAHVHNRIVPQITFKLDESIEYGNKIDKILKNIKN